ncbi:tannase/feruloyl esterase family alpha/beta hydrolase [Donghicola mangrovi]|uniref:Tannase/feruloyl esterase family alpha/beta hydrolase n=1 Tax=Donghicola mangrovi TaxID=2729614 RepID=A0A850Q6P1_9RHOB|nr:tannase/feruloyl esterase family alpha/beta hydrolase [Donghicola mangrovi]
MTGAAHVADSREFPPYCQITGEILPITSDAPPILFQINLPDNWNGKAVQMGGGGLNGTVVTGLDNIVGTGPAADEVTEATTGAQTAITGADATVKPLARGYVTFGSDSGHQGNTFDGSFASSDEARRNYAGEAVKKLRDVAGTILSEAYGRAAERVYYIGGSKGGQEALVAAQRYGADFDGVVSYYPAKDNGALILGWWELTQAAYFSDGGYLPPEAQQLVHDRTLAACDALDGIKDGVVANVSACEASFAPHDLLCNEGKTAGCLSPAQVATLQRGTERLTLPYEMANGISRIGPFPATTGGDLTGLWFTEDGSPLTPQSLFVREIARHFLTGNPDLELANIDLESLRKPMQAYANGTDATSTDLSDFLAHDGKMILVQGTTDMLVPEPATTDYALRLQASHDGARAFLRYYVQPGYGHGMGVYNMNWDSLAALDAWVETGTAPVDPVSNAVVAGALREMPLCEYPAFPRFAGGDPAQAGSFACALR